MIFVFITLLCNSPNVIYGIKNSFERDDNKKIWLPKFSTDENVCKEKSEKGLEEEKIQGLEKEFGISRDYEPPAQEGASSSSSNENPNAKSTRSE